MIINNGGFATNTSYDCRKAARRDDRRKARYIDLTPRGPVYENRMPQPKSEFAQKSGALLSKIGSFFASVGASFAEAANAELTPNETLSASDIAFMESLEGVAVEFDTEEEAKAAYDKLKKPRHSKRRVKKQPTADIKPKTEPQKQPGILDIKADAEAKARAYNDERAELFERLKNFEGCMPEKGAYKYISIDALDAYSNDELSELLDDIQKTKISESIRNVSLNKHKWAETEEYLLFSDEINVEDFIKLLKQSNADILNEVEMDGLCDWVKHNGGNSADFRYSGDVVHNWNLTNLKQSMYQCYLVACEDGGKLDHDVELLFPNGTSTPLSKFIGADKFDEIANIDTPNVNILKKAG